MGASKIMSFIQRRKAASLALSQGHGASAANDAFADATAGNAPVPSDVPPFVPSVPSEFSREGTDKINEINAVPPVPSVPSQKTIVWEKIRGNNTTVPIVDWHQADRAYQAHHWSCPQCQASGKGYGSRCDEGQRLWDAYEAAPMPERVEGKRWPIPPAPAPSAAPYHMTPRSEPEIVRMVELHRRAIHAGLLDDAALDKLLDALMDAPSDMGCCFACSHLRGSSPERWKCAGHGHELSGLPLARTFMVQLHRCAGYEPPPMS